jgi:hypothetical protein
MVSKLILSLSFVAGLVCFCPATQAQDPFAFQFGYTLGYQNSFRNRLPTPPYFSIYPPVYYGKRFERPYGDSPFAAFPQLQSASNYHPVPKDTAIRNRTVVNPHVDHIPRMEINSEPVAVVAPRVGRTVEIINPFASELYASKGR